MNEGPKKGYQLPLRRNKEGQSGRKEIQEQKARKKMIKKEINMDKSR